MKVSNKAWICSFLVCGTLIGIHKELRKQKNEPTYNEKQIENFIKYYNTFDNSNTYEQESNMYLSDEYIYIDGEFIKREDFNKYMDEYYKSHIEEKVKQKIR